MKLIIRNAHGFSLHAAVRCGAGQCKKLERLCRYITRHAIAEGNLHWVERDGNRENPKRQLTVIDRVGKVLGTIPLASGMGLTTNVAFGRGIDASSLYVSTGAPWGLFRIKTAKRGHYF